MRSLFSLLSHLNSLPFRMTIKHYYPLSQSNLKDGKLDSCDSWEILRNENPHFIIPNTREKWVQHCLEGIGRDGQDGLLASRANDIINLLNANGITSVHSVGVGAAALEYFLKKLNPELYLTVSEYFFSNVEILQKVFIECDSIIEFDLLSPIGNNGGGTHLMLLNRVDPGFTDEQWIFIFTNMHNSQVSNILFIPGGMLSLRYFFMEKKRLLIHTMFKKDMLNFAGYARTKKQFSNYWSGMYSMTEVRVGGTKGFFLKANFPQL